MVKPTVVKPATRQKAGLKIRLLPSKSGKSLLKPVVKTNKKPYSKQKRVISTKKVARPTQRKPKVAASKKPIKKTDKVGSIMKKTQAKVLVKSSEDKQQTEKKTPKVKTETVLKKQELNVSRQAVIDIRPQVPKGGKKQVISESDQVTRVITLPPSRTDTTLSKVVRKPAVQNRGPIQIPVPKGGRFTGGGASNVLVVSKPGTQGGSSAAPQLLGSNAVSDKNAESLARRGIYGKTCRVLSADEVKKHVHLPPQVIGLFGLTKQTYTCLDCHSGPFLTRDQLNRHKHQCLFKSAGLKVACFTCNQLFPDRKALNEHQKNVHWNLKTILTPEEKELARKHVLEMKGQQYKSQKKKKVPTATLR